MTHHRFVDQKKVLIVQLDSFGDLCTSIPHCLELKTLGYSLDIVCKAGLEPVCGEFLPDAEIFSVITDDWSNLQCQLTYRQLRAKSYDAVFVFTRTPQAAFISTCPKTNRRIGLIEAGKRYYGSTLLFSHRYNCTKNEHVATRFSGIIALYHKGFQCHQKSASNLALPDLRRNVVVFHPGGSWKPRRWPADRFLEVARYMESIGCKVVILIQNSESDLLEFFARSQTELITFSIAHSIDNVISVVKECALFIGNDSGPMHLANLYNKRSIILWGPGNLERIRPIGDNMTLIYDDISCRPCSQHRHPQRCAIGENKCLTGITSDRVISKIQDII